jgi:hypothetical protein
VGTVSSEEIIAAVLQGRAVLGVKESVEAALIATLRDRTAAVTGGRTHRSHIAPTSKEDRTADPTRRARQ